MYTSVTVTWLISVPVPYLRHGCGKINKPRSRSAIGSEPVNYIDSGLGVMIRSMRLLLARPSAVLLLAIGRVSP